MAQDTLNYSNEPLIRNFSIGRRMPEKSSGSEAVEIYFRLHQRVVSGGMRHSSPLMESPSQIALNRRRERKGLKPETNDESSHLTGDLSAGQISEELEDVDPIRRQGLANVESLEVGGDQCKLGKLGKLETPSRIQQAGARDKVYIDPSWKDAVEKAVEVPLVEHGEAPSEPSNKLLANQLAASPAVLAATAARAEERSRVHEPSKSRRLSDVSDQSIKTENNIEAEVKTEKKADLLAPVLPPVQPLIPELKVDVEAEEPPGRQVEFLSTVLESGQPLIPELRIALEAETKPRRQNVRFNLPPKQMEGRLQVRQPEMSLHKAKAVEDARQAQAAVNEMCRLAGRPPPIWALCELIGKGTYGRVYMGKNMSTAEVVAIKTIDIDESDQINPRHADSFTDWVKEVNALKSLKEINAKNVNHVIAAEPVGTVMWLVTEHCAGGSVQTLMKPTAPGGLLEKWIIPILREAAEGIKWVHQAGLIHRDIKCANVLIQEDGGVQLCDFGVAGVIEDRFDKRSTIVGTPHWMAPELLKSTSAYGKEVDIWAFGAMAFELATGLPPSVAKGHFHFEDVAEYLAHNVPRLEGGNFSDGLRNIVAYLLEELPEQRPKIEQVQQHSYIANTERQYPTSSLSQLVVAFKQWVDHGGTRKSLFQPGGAQRKEVDLTSDPAGIGNEDWNFSTTQAFDNRVSKHIDPRDVFEAYGENVVEFDTARPKVSRRRPPPQALAALPNPLVKVFDPNTVSNYYPNSKTYYGVAPEQYLSQGPPTSDLPLRDDSARMQIKDTMIDLGGHDMDTGLSSFPDMDTLKAGNPRIVEDDTYLTNNQDFHRPPLSDPADINPNRRTQDWKFPSFAPPASADPEISRFPPSSYELPRPGITPGVGGRPALIHHPTEPLGGAFGGGLSSNGPSMDRRSMAESLIDLDMSMPDSYPEIVRPSTANSEAGSATSEQMPSGNPFEFERHVSYQAPSNEYEPTLYVEDTRIDLGGSRSSLIDLDDARVSRINLDDAIVSRIDDDPRPPRFDYEKARESRIDLDEASIPRIDMDAAMTPPRDINDISDFSEVESGPNGPGSDPNEASRYDSHGFSDSDYISMPPSKGLNLNTIFTMSHFPVLPNPPSAAALAGTASREEMSDELSRSLGSMTAQLEAFRDVYESPAVTRSHSRRK
ncbi:putative Serine/threonine-protein kinase nak1 [Glarea lozoyensis 74030]|uniref:non-specific serine/threonine protein kinase n=1 Tax=Glarea lozoyensis (strain ATCC 74030 / MF5533) TaxID=1104152 RepID=H0ECW4_GLAL7|nr:putative Serine/threonine-protein kinase nak1 [Glarea lozoyensis 74030]